MSCQRCLVTPSPSVWPPQPDLVEQVRTNADARRALGDTDVVLITIGANDVVETFTETSDRDCDDTCIAGTVDTYAAFSR